MNYVLTPGQTFNDFDSVFENINAGECYAINGRLVNPIFINIDMRGWSKWRSSIVALKGSVILINATFLDIVLDQTLAI